MTRKVTARMQLASVLLGLPPSGETIHFQSLALGLGVSPGLISRHLKEFRERGWIVTRRAFIEGMWVRVVNRVALETLAKGGDRERAGLR